VNRIFTKLQKCRKGNYAPILTLAFVVFNILVYILVQAFGSDLYAEQIGSVGAIGDAARRANETQTNQLIQWPDLSWIDQLGWIIGDLPWWLTVFAFSFQLIFVAVIIAAWVRGL